MTEAISHAPPLGQPDGDGSLPGLAYVTEKVFGQTWAARYPPGIAALTASMRVEVPCPICQHPTSDCTGEHDG